MIRATSIALALAALAAPLTAMAADSDEAVTAAYATWNEAFNKGDAKALGALYTEDALLLPPDHKVHKGPAGVEEFFGGLFANGVTGHRLELIEAEEYGDVIVASANWSAKGKDASGAPAAFGGVATHVFEKQPDGSLKLELLTFN